MAWYRAGTVTVTNGSAGVTGAGTDFVSNTQVGEVFLGPDGRVYEIGAVVSATQLTIIPAYQGATAGGQAYGLQPTASFARDLALAAVQLLNGFGAVRDGIGQGLIADGAPATPGIRFAADQDTGVCRLGANQIALVAGGVPRITADQTGIRFQTGNGDVLSVKSNTARGAGDGYMAFYDAAGRKAYIGYGAGDDTFFLFNEMAMPLLFGTSGTERGRFDAAGNLLVGVANGAAHTFVKASGLGGEILTVTNAATFFNGDVAGYSGSAACVKLFSRGSTGRSLNASGTINATGADYAEYMTKAAGCGTIAAGDVCGVDRDGHLTRTWSDAVSFVVKSTDPAYVGGDSWAQHLPPRPEASGAEPIAPTAPVPPADDADDMALDAWRSATAAYAARMAALPAARAAWQAAADAHARDLAAWEAALEAERVKVDRIAFCGQVPVNVWGDFAVGDYLIAVANGAGIKTVAVPEADITFEQYRRRLGRVWAVRDGRAWVDVQHG